MIPKIIHYCWFGGNPLPESAKKCIASWRKYLPDYEIKEWNESNFDVYQCAYVAEAYHAKNWAFVSDYARMWILYKYGGLYFDTDVEVIRNMDDIIARGPFMGSEASDEQSIKGPRDKAATLGVAPGLGLGVNPGLGLGVNPGLGLIKEIVESYQKEHLYTWKGKLTETIVARTTRFINKHSREELGNGIYKAAGVFVYPPEYFCPKNYYTGELNITSNTRSIHHYSATWVKKTDTIKKKIIKRTTYFSYRLWGSLIYPLLYKSNNK